MFARFLILIAVITSFIAGPAMPGNAWAWLGVKVERCGCCVATVEPTCCAAPTTPVQRPPVSSTTASQEQLKIALQPVVTILPACLVEKPKVAPSSAPEVVQRTASRLIDRLCILLI